MWIYVHNGILLSHSKRNAILPFGTTRMDLESIMIGEISQISLICGIKKKHKTNEQT